jgi:hypothetical protein
MRAAFLYSKLEPGPDCSGIASVGREQTPAPHLPRRDDVTPEAFGFAVVETPNGPRYDLT